jgi:hypothetical protein
MFNKIFGIIMAGVYLFTTLIHLMVYDKDELKNSNDYQLYQSTHLIDETNHSLPTYYKYIPLASYISFAGIAILLMIFASMGKPYNRLICIGQFLFVLGTLIWYLPYIMLIALGTSEANIINKIKTHDYLFHELLAKILQTVGIIMVVLF